MTRSVEKPFLKSISFVINIKNDETLRNHQRDSIGTVHKFA